MTTDLPAWVFEPATPQDRARAAQARKQDVLHIDWTARKGIRSWAKQQGWPAPGFFSDAAFLNKMLESDANFALALAESGIGLRIPIERYVLPADRLAAFDDYYEGRDWGVLVGELRELRRIVEAGVVVEVEGRKLKSFNTFYTWAHGRYYLLEEGYDSWIGDDKS